MDVPNGFCSINYIYTAFIWLFTIAFTSCTIFICLFILHLLESGNLLVT